MNEKIIGKPIGIVEDKPEDLSKLTRKQLEVRLDVLRDDKYKLSSLQNNLVGDEEYERLTKQFPKLTWPCPTCKGAKKYRMPNEGGITVEYECACDMQYALYKNYVLTGINDDWTRLDWKDWKGDEKALRATYRWLLQYEEHITAGLGLFFYGQRGSGTTMLAILALKELVKFGYYNKPRMDRWNAYFTTHGELMTRWVKRSSEQDEEALRRFESEILYSTILVIDKLEKPKVRQDGSKATFQAEVLAKILQERGERTTFLTTNATLKADKTNLDAGVEIYGEDVVNLLGSCTLNVPVLGTSYRLTEKQQRQNETKLGWQRPVR